MLNLLIILACKHANICWFCHTVYTHSVSIITEDTGPRGHARWQWWVTFAPVNGPPWFNRHFLVQWTALWVIRIPLLPAVALYLIASSGWKSLRCVSGVGWGGAGLVCGNSSSIGTRWALQREHTHTHSQTPTPTPTCQPYTHQISRPHLPLSIHVYLTETWMAFLLDRAE